MADKEKKDKEGVGAAGALIVVLIIISFVSTMCLLIKCDVGGFGSSVLRPVFKDVPVIKEILPDASEAEVAKESDLPYKSYQEALDACVNYRAQVEGLESELATMSDAYSELQVENARLKEFEDAQADFAATKKAFYDEIVYGDSAPDVETYTAWYAELDAENAERIYQEIITREVADKEVKEVAAAYESMEPGNAAKIFESMANDLDTVALIMNNMSTEHQGEILQEMDPVIASAITKKLLP